MGKDKTKWNTFDRFCEILATTLPICSNELYSHGMTNSKAASKVFKKLQLETKKNTNFTFPTAKGSRKYKDGLPATCNAPKDDKRVKDFFDTFIQENKKWIVNEIEKEISAHSNKKQSLASQIQGDSSDSESEHSDPDDEKDDLDWIDDNGNDLQEVMYKEAQDKYIFKLDQLKKQIFINAKQDCDTNDKDMQNSTKFLKTMKDMEENNSKVIADQLLKIQKEKEELLERFKKQEEDIAKQEEQYVKPLTKLVNEVAKLIEVKKEKIRQKEEEEKNQIEANYQTLSNFETSPEIFANILIVEEDALSHFLIVKRSNLVKGITLIADIGHESVDICVEERTEKETKVIYRNGEFTGLRSIHDIIKKKFPKENSFKIMEKFFLESEIINLPLAKPQPIFPLLEDCKTEIVNAIKSIVMSIGLTAAYCCVQEIHVIGAVTSSPFFMYHITQELSEAKVNETLDRLRLHLKDDYQNMRFCGCRFYFNPLDRSPLLEGMLYMINTALKLEKPVSFCFEQAIPKENKPQYVLGFLDIDDNGQYGLNVQKDWNSLFLTFDFELAILGLFPIVDLKKIGRITQNNFHQWGIFSFERFGTVFAEVDPSFETTKRKFLISGEVQKDTVTIEIIFSGLGGYRQCELEIGRNGRMERVSISDVPKVVLATKEKDFKTWYGSHYKISITISEKNSFLLSSNQRTLKEEKFGDDFERIRIRKDSNHRAIVKKIVNYTIKKRK
ncbi:hypothetical protein C9374_000325 [Naegleria lovaniensis]|uniref:Uncharacterized protein n=1 Tax=Naegleria lovaniensis TaxID=51637 RepID=A0AA88KPR3_NAELO|nr:uncharacterized protein C9374_000325 [Naegleria lovaniensis]KAG2388886.1 hypothetical protein C9374_000325 [Naegleria lovaniensis]